MKPAQRSMSNPIFRILRDVRLERTVPEDKNIARINFTSPVMFHKKMPLKPVKEVYEQDHHDDYNPNAVVSGQVPLNRNW